MTVMRRPFATTDDRAIVGRLAEQQGGCVARPQLRWLGLADRTISHLARREGWTTVHTSVFRMPGVPDSPRSRLWAVVLALAPQHLEIWRRSRTR